MKYVKSNYNGDAQELLVFPMGDIHIGSPHFMESVLLNQLKKVKENRENSRIILMGDIIECATKGSPGSAVYEQRMTPEEQIDKAIEYFEPYKDLIDGVVTGNHEMRAHKETGVDLMRYFCRVLGIEDKYLGYQGIVGFNWNNRCYTFSVWHGHGGGGTAGGAMNKVKRQQLSVLADVYLMGHVHRLDADVSEYRVPMPQHETVRVMKQYFVLTGSALKWEGSYAEQAGLPPAPVGFPIVKLFGGRKMENGTRYTKKIDVVLT